MPNDDEIAEAVDQFANQLNASWILGTSIRLGITVDDILERICEEVRCRLDP